MKFLFIIHMLSCFRAFIQEEKKTLDRELARAKVTANRVAVVVANEWKDANDKVMPVKQWLEERRFLQVGTPINCTLPHPLVGIWRGLSYFNALISYLVLHTVSAANKSLN